MFGIGASCEPTPVHQRGIAPFLWEIIPTGEKTMSYYMTVVRWYFFGFNAVERVRLYLLSEQVAWLIEIDDEHQDEAVAWLRACEALVR